MINDVNGEEIIGTFYENELQNKNQYKNQNKNQCADILKGLQVLVVVIRFIFGNLKDSDEDITAPTTINNYLSNKLSWY